MVSERIQRQIDRLLDQAEEAMGRLEWGTGRECARVVLGLDSTNSEALAFLGSVEKVLPGEPGVQDQPSPSSDTPTKEQEQPTSFANGRYEVKRFLGEGGKKVYLAQDTLLDREVAFALIKTEGLDEVCAHASPEKRIKLPVYSRGCSTQHCGC